MTPPTPPKPGARHILIWGLALLGFGVSGWALWTAGNLNSELVASALNVRLLALFPIVLLGVIFRSVRLQIMATATGESIAFWKTVRITLIDDLASGISPGRVAGEPARWITLRRLGISRGRVGIILGGEFATDLLINFGIISTVLLLDRYASWTQASWQWSQLSILCAGVIPLVGLFFLRDIALTHLQMLADASAAFLRRLPRTTPVLGMQKLRIAENLQCGAQETRLQIHRLVRCGKRQWAFACLMGLGHGLSRLALLPVVACALDTEIALFPMLLWECVVYYGLAFVPLPGGGGSAESASLLYLNRYLAPGQSALLLIFWRFFDCYLLIALGGLVLLLGGMPGISPRALVSFKRAPQFPEGR